MRVICIGAHPDDCEIGFGGTAAKLAARSDAVKFVSVTNGEAGHHLHPGPKQAATRQGEAQEAARRLGSAQLVQDSAYLVMVPFVCPDIAVDIDDVWPRKVDALDAHQSQVYERLPWVNGDRVAAQVRHAEVFELSEYGRKLSAQELDDMFPR